MDPTRGIGPLVGVACRTDGNKYLKCEVCDTYVEERSWPQHCRDTHALRKPWTDLESKLLKKTSSDIYRSEF